MSKEIQIRHATVADAAEITTLLASLGYPDTEPFIGQRIQTLRLHPDACLLVAEQHGQLCGVLSLHFIPQLALAGDFCRISYFCIGDDVRGQGIGALLEVRATELARARNCDRIEVHCHSRRTDAHRFYARQGYTESPKYLMKSVR